MRSEGWTRVVPVGLLLALTACAEPEPDNLVRKTIGPGGGLISSHDDVLTLVFQPGALRAEEEIEVFPSDEPPPIFGPAYRVRPDVALAVDVEVTYRRVLPSDPGGAAVGAIRYDDYSARMGHWTPLPRLAINVDQQGIIASDDELSLYYGLLEDAEVPAPAGDGSGSAGTTGPGPGEDATGTTSSVETTGEPDPTSGNPTTGSPTTGPTTGDPTTGGPDTDTAGEGPMTDTGMVMPMCGDAMPQIGELCLVMGADYPAGLAPIDVGVGNFDGDPALDVVTLDLGALAVELLPGNGDGTLMAPAGGTPAGMAPAALSVGDFTGEGMLDVVVLDTGADSVGLLAGDGAGGLAALVATTAGVGIVGLDDADFDGDAARDLAVLNGTDGTVQMLLGGPGGLLPGPTGMVGGGVDAAVASGSLNAAADDYDDILALGPGGYHAWASDGMGTGYVGDISGAFGGGGTFVVLTTGDIDGDGSTDVVALDVAADTMVVGMSTGGPATYDFAAVPPVAVGTDPSDVVLADLDGDGDLEAVVCNATSDDVMIFAWTGGYGAPAFTFPTGMAPSGVAVGDLDGDGVPDVVVSNEGSGSVTVVLSDP